MPLFLSFSGNGDELDFYENIFTYLTNFGIEAFPDIPGVEYWMVDYVNDDLKNNQTDRSEFNSSGENSGIYTENTDSVQKSYTPIADVVLRVNTLILSILYNSNQNNTEVRIFFHVL